MKHVLLWLTCVGVLQATLPAQAPVPPITDTRLTVHTLLREDIFAGFLQDDQVRLARAEQNIESMLAIHPREGVKMLSRESCSQVSPSPELRCASDLLSSCGRGRPRANVLSRSR